MPHVALLLSGEPDHGLTRDVASAVAALTERVLGKRPEVISVTTQYVPHDRWIIAGESLATQGKNAFQVDITITDETNTKVEKAEFLRAVFDAISERLGNVHPCSYIHVIDARAAAYGYGGQTQEFRFQQRT